jgi:hypothetical protein
MKERGILFSAPMGGNLPVAVVRSAWTWRETRDLRAAIPRILRSPLAAPELFERLSAIAEVSERRMWRALRWCMDAGSVVRVGAFRHRATYSAAARVGAW